MTGPSLYLDGLAAHVPAVRAVADAVAAGECDARLADSTGMRSVAVSAGESGPELAATAARAALAAARPAGEPAIVLHASAYYQGVDMWSPASYVQRETVGGTAPAVEVRQVSNGGLAALALARAWLLAGGGDGWALLSTGDRFGPPAYDRWRTDPGTVYGDGGTAAVLGTAPGPVRLRSVVLTGEPELEGWHRDGHPFGRVQTDTEPVVDLAARQKLFLARAGRAAATGRVAAGRDRAIAAALAEAGAGWSELAFFVLPQMGAARLTRTYYEPLGIDADRTAWDRAREVGHLGAGDPFCGLDHLLRTGRARPGDLGLLLGVGAGFSWGAAVVEVL